MSAIRIDPLAGAPHGVRRWLVRIDGTPPVLVREVWWRPADVVVLRCSLHADLGCVHVDALEQHLGWRAEWGG